MQHTLNFGRTNKLPAANNNQLITEKANLEAKLAGLEHQMRAVERELAIARVHNLVESSNLSWREVIPLEVRSELQADILPPPPLSKLSLKPRGFTATGRKIPTKYRDLQGNTWTGRGRPPLWFRAAIAAGVNPEDLRIR